MNNYLLILYYLSRTFVIRSIFIISNDITANLVTDVASSVAIVCSYTVPGVYWEIPPVLCLDTMTCVPINTYTLLHFMGCFIILSFVLKLFLFLYSVCLYVTDPLPCTWLW